MALNTFKYINVYYNKGDRKPYDVNGKPIAYLGTDYVGANEATIIRFNIGDDTGVIDAVADVKRPDGEKSFLVMSKVNVGGDVFYELPLTDWHTAKVGKLVIAFKAFNGTITINDGVIDATGLRVIVSDIFNVEIGYAPNSVQEAPAFDPNDVATFVAALSTKLDKANGINVVQALPTPNDGSLNGRWYLVKTGTEEQLGRLYVFDGDTPIAVELQAEGIKLTPVGNGDVTADTGRMDWQQSNGTVSLGLYNDVFAQLGEDVFYYVKASGAITKGDVVQYAGYQGDHALAKRAVQSEVNANPKLIMGIAKQDIANGDFGYVAHFGKIESVDTKGVAVNSFVWFDSAGSTAGAWTITPPTAPNAKVLLAVILKAETSGPANNGVMLVRPTIEPKLDELQNVLITSVANGNVLRYDGTKWVNTNGLSALETNLQDYKDDLNDGTITVDKARKDANGDTIDTTYLKVATASATYIPLSQKAQPLGVATLGSDGRVLPIQLPASIGEILEFADISAFPPTGTQERIYIALDTNKTYRWSGTQYVEISQSLALGTTSSTAFPGDRGLATETQSNNIVSGVQGLTDTRITNSAIGTSPLIINSIASTTANLFEARNNNTLWFSLDSFGNAKAGNINQRDNGNNAYVFLETTGAVIGRNINDTNPALIVRKNLGTGNILELQTGTSDKKLEVDVNGWFYQNGTRLFTQPASVSNTFFGSGSGNLTLTGTDNTIYGQDAGISLTSATNNTIVGRSALRTATTSNSTVAIGVNSGRTITTGGNNTFVGQASGFNASQLATATNSTALGHESFTDKSNQMVFGNASVSEFKFDRNASAVLLAPEIQSSSANANSIETTTVNTNDFLASLILRRTSSNDMADGFGSNISFQIRDSANVTNLIADLGAVRSGADNSGRLLFRTRNAGTTTEKMTILPNGNVGIGTGSPTFPSGNGLVVFDSFIARVDLKNTATGLTGSDGSGIAVFGNDFYIYNRENAKIFFDTQATTRMTIDGNGLVGINETSPSAQLQVRSGATNRVPLIVDTLASHTENLQVWRVNGNANSWITNGGRFISSAGISFTNGNQAGINFDANGTVIRRNIADTNPALIVDLANAGATGNIQVWQKAGVAQLAVGNDGTLANATANNATLKLSNTGTIINRNVNDANVAVTINQQQGTGKIASFQYGGVEKSYIDKDGNFSGAVLPPTYTLLGTRLGSAGDGTITVSDITNYDELVADFHYDDSANELYATRTQAPVATHFQPTGSGERTGLAVMTFSKGGTTLATATVGKDGNNTTLKVDFGGTVTNALLTIYGVTY